MSNPAPLSLVAEPALCIVARPNDALGPTRRWLVFASIAGFSLLLALVCALAGAWMVLPYSLLEVGALAGAFYWVGRHAGDWERLTVIGDRVLVERETCGERQQREFNRYWLRVEIDAQGVGRTPRLTLHGAGKSCEFGGALPVAERLRLARELRRLSAAN